MSRCSSGSFGSFGYVVCYISSRSHKEKPRDPLYEKNDLIILFVFIVLLGSSLIIQIVRIDLSVVNCIKAKQ